MDVSPREKGVLVFGPFRLDPVRRTLLRDGRVLTLTARLFDTLLYLVQNPERLVTRNELEIAVWGGRVVEDGNLRKAVSALRKALQTEADDDTIIATVPGRGFRFAMPVAFEPEADPETEPGSFPSAEGATPLAPARSWRTLAAIAVGAVAMVGGVFWYFADRPAPFSPPAHSVAVLAFTNLSGDPGQEYFSDGLSEELINSLGRIQQVRVVARQSAFSFKGKSATIADIARLLNVGTVLEGSVRRKGQQLRITAQLIDAATGYQLWSHSFDRDEGNILNIQTEIAEAVTTALQVTLLGADVARLTLGSTKSSAALDAYLRGTHLSYRPSESNMRQALAAFDEALAVDPAFTSARVQRAMTLLTIANVFPGNDATLEKKTEADALAEAERSVSQAPELAIAHAALASVLEFIRWDFAGAEREYARAMELEPGNSWAASQSWRLLMDLGHYDAAVAMAKRGTELNPLAIGQYVSLAYTLIYTGHPDDALAALQHAEQLGFSGDRDTQLRGLIALRMGEFEKALRICAAEHDWMGNYCLAIGDHSLGKQADADAQLTKLRALLGDNGTVQYADIYAQWGRPDDALHWLETAYRLHDPGLLDMKPDWFLDPIRDTPRYKDIERRMNFPL